MSLAGLKKQFNKANQFMSEKIGGAKGTELDDDFILMEKQVDTIGKLVEDLMSRTNELLQPNPASRAKMVAMKGVSKLRGQHGALLYPQPEGQLGECMTRYGRELGDESLLGLALTQCGESYRQLAEVKYSLEDGVRQNFIEPLLHLQSKDLKEVNFHRKKMSGRRLDYDCKRRKQQKDPMTVTDYEIEQAAEKFEESKELAEVAMLNLLENEVEQLSQLAAFVDAEVSYHQQSLDVLQALQDVLRRKCSDAASRPRTEHVPRRATTASSSSSQHRSSVSSPGYDSGYDLSESSYRTSPPSQPAAHGTGGAGGARAKALYDFEAENEAELPFREGDMITLLSRIDDNWFEGSLRGKTGLFPVTYVEVISDLP